MTRYDGHLAGRVMLDRRLIVLTLSRSSQE
jgi:hypothetical protein